MRTWHGINLGKGTFLLRKNKSSIVVRKVICSNTFNEDLWHYEEYWQNSIDPIAGAARSKSLKAWGSPISEEQALELIPQLGKLGEVSDKTKLALQQWAKIIAMNVRNSMEDFHCDHLSDEQMKELNPIVRKAIYQSLRYLWLLKNGSMRQQALGAAHISHAMLMIPQYWEDPELTEEELSKDSEFSKKIIDEGLPVIGNRESCNKLQHFILEQLGIF